MDFFGQFYFFLWICFCYLNLQWREGRSILIDPWIVDYISLGENMRVKEKGGENVSLNGISFFLFEFDSCCPYSKPKTKQGFKIGKKWKFCTFGFWIAGDLCPLL